MEAPFEIGYRVRASRRARHVRLVLSDDGELTVVVPFGVPSATAAAAIEANRVWLERALARIGPVTSPTAPARPELIDLRAIGERWTVTYERSAHRCCSSTRDRVLSITTPMDSDDEVRRTLDRWLRRRALAHLEPRVLDLADERAIAVTKVAVRSPRTRWASCSASGAIMLNSQLLFLPPALVDHVILHELCHRLELNHSPRFWRLLEASSPGARKTDAELRRAKALVPRFLRA